MLKNQVKVPVWAQKAESEAGYGRCKKASYDFISRKKIPNLLIR